MTLFVDTSVWSLAFRRAQPSAAPEVAALTAALQQGQSIVSTGLVFQELLQGFSGPRDRDQIVRHFSSVPVLVPDREDHLLAADLRNACRRAGVQVGTIDALLAQLCLNHDLVMLSTDQDFLHMARHCPLQVWTAS